jgi:phosphatidylserine/phosphatidylglycerophosphate/cardiolipin synthase-like enzyme
VTRIGPRAVIACWELIKRAGVDLFRPSAARGLPSLQGWAASGAPAGDLEAPQVSFIDALKAVALRERSGVHPDIAAELVVTLPVPDRTLLSTPDVVRTMIDSATKSILVIGFRMSEENMRRALFRRGVDGLRVTVVGDRNDGGARELRKDWPAMAQPLTALENVESAQRSGLLHGKVLVIDERIALIGSANFSRSGMNSNFEFGVRVGGQAAADVVRLTERLVRAGWFVPVVL